MNKLHGFNFFVNNCEVILVKKKLLKYLLNGEINTNFNIWFENKANQVTCNILYMYLYIEDVWFDREAQKAAQCYTEAKAGLQTEAFLTQSLLQTDELNPRVLEVLYYLKVRAFTALQCL